MANQSILNAFERMWHHVVTALSNKADTTHSHDASEIVSGTFSTNNLPVVPIANGGTGATDVAGALANLGLTNLTSGTKIVSGSYAGIGTTEEYKSTDVTLDGRPKLVIISSSGDSSYSNIFAIKGNVSFMIYKYADNDAPSIEQPKITLTSTGFSITPTRLSGGDYFSTLSISGVRYYYTAFI